METSIEPLGLADPVPIARALLRNPVLSRLLRLDATLSTVDAALGRAQLAPTPRRGPRWRSPTACC